MRPASFAAFAAAATLASLATSLARSVSASPTAPAPLLGALVSLEW